MVSGAAATTTCGATTPSAAVTARNSGPTRAGTRAPHVVVAAAPVTTLAVPRWLALASSLAITLGAARAAAEGLAPGGRPGGGGGPAGVGRGERQLAGGGTACRALDRTGPRVPAGRDDLGALPWARLKRFVWFHSVLLTAAGYAGSRRRAPRGGMVYCGAGGSRAHGAGGGSALPALDRLDELALAHPAYTRDAHGLRYSLQLRQQHAGQRTTWGTSRRAGARTAARPAASCRRYRSRRGHGSGARPWLGLIGPGGIPGQIPGTGEELGGFAHEGSFPETQAPATGAGRPGVTAR